MGKKKAAAPDNQISLWGLAELPAPTAKPVKVLKQNANPCVVVYGKGPEGRVCAGCIFFVEYHRHVKKHGDRLYETTHKCQIRGVTRVVKTDHKGTLDACSKYHDREAALAEREPGANDTNFYTSLEG